MLIPLEPSFLQTHGREETEKVIRQIVRSVAFELVESESAFRLMGPKMSYHLMDPYLPKGLRSLGKSMTLADILAFTSRRPNFDLCLEDSWTGYFVAKHLERVERPRDVLLIHLDDHADMMPTLLFQSGESLIDPASGGTFDPMSADDWHKAIHSGAVNIGNYLTALFYSGFRLHIRHINNSKDTSEVSYVSREPRQYPLILDKRFANIRKSDTDSDESIGTYRSGPNPDDVLENAPEAYTLLHIDLDYFIYDFDGTPRGTEYVPDAGLQRAALTKMDRFFSALARLNLKIEHTIIATSPGFCSAYHWDFLLTEIENRILDFQRAVARA